MRPRDVVDEIGGIRERRKGSPAFLELSTRLSSISRAFEAINAEEMELIRYFPVAVVATIESYFKQSFQELIDAGEPFLSNVSKLAASIKLDIAMFRDIHKKRLTIGELIAHGISISRYEQLDSAASEVIGKSFSGELQTISDRWLHEVVGAPKQPMLLDTPKTLAAVSRMFELRHVICHETATGLDVKHNEVAACLMECRKFLDASEQIFQELRNPGAPLTQLAMNLEAGVRLGEKEQRLKEAVESLIREMSDDERSVFLDAQKKWEEFRNSWARCQVGDPAHSGSIWPLENSLAHEKLVDERLAQLGSGAET